MRTLLFLLSLAIAALAGLAHRPTSPRSSPPPASAPAPAPTDSCRSCMEIPIFP